MCFDLLGDSSLEGASCGKISLAEESRKQTKNDVTGRETVTYFSFLLESGFCTKIFMGLFIFKVINTTIKTS